jgi:hypothetical protein
MRQILIPWQSGGQHPTLPDQRHPITIVKPTIDTMQQTLQLLDYLATQENAVLSYHASDMVLAVKKNSFAAAASAAAAAAAATATAVVVFIDSGLIIVIAVDCHCPRRRRCCHFCCHRRCSLL